MEVVPLLIRQQGVGGSSGLVMRIDDLCLVQLLGTQLDYVPGIAAFLSLAVFLLGSQVTAISVLVIASSDLRVAG